MTRFPHQLLRAPVQITIWLLLLIVTLGPHHSLFVCTTGCCWAAPPAEADGCSCCQENACCSVAHDDGGSTDKNVARGCHDCCIDVAVLTELGPMPRTVDCPDLDPPFLGEVPYGADAGLDHGVEAPRPRNNGPPRPDRPTNLLATTILRQ